MRYRFFYPEHDVNEQHLVESGERGPIFTLYFIAVLENFEDIKIFWVSVFGFSRVLDDKALFSAVLNYG